MHALYLKIPLILLAIFRLQWYNSREIIREGTDMYDFITDLDEYFCEKYASYDKLTVIPGYKMPVMQATETREDGRKYSYTLPADTMRLANQEKKAEILAQLKEKMADNTFSFSFRVNGFFTRLKASVSKYGFYKQFNKMLAKYNLSDTDVLDVIDVDEEIWRNIKKGKFAPTKNLLLSIALTLQFSMDDVNALFLFAGYEWDYTYVKDVIVSYLLINKVYNRPMIDAALAEYKVGNLFIR